ncbi:MAG: pyruvate ferredoxin oxidoreductase [Latescibacteria bacterium DG_63]|jgi:pyruvate ferredoxin oxidoreductase beta subunit|uniref:Pyruvate ferredoxin oxidoreductase n=2 Tax=Bacteria division TA06 TaxID=1156500 RepID=A0A0S8JNJ3_UNCT6|nr:MAG: pyruvate ferredoxin oxidoreductase [Latescibacteria bacterium DG_63]KPK69534.1 MAG: pyruvate ferredoxin oxidoreductase [candidate division TA06 bacterium SM23_40]KPL10787.1 MAG: pyruvate ferredoxin oxidoreductase [candidate division TA06 bacterium SM1_40]
MANLKELATREELLTGGHRLCAGCAASIIVRQILLSSKYPLVVSSATGCLEVATTIYPYTAWKTAWIHSAFENVAATISGVEAAYTYQRRTGTLDQEFRFIAFAGDGGTYDIGIQALSGALERGHQFLYVCYDNQAYMNTGIQRSSATPAGAWTTTCPPGKQSRGKRQYRKNLTEVVAAHRIPYAAQASPSHWKDLVTKIEKALEVEGPAFMNIIAPCPRGWRHETDETIEIARLAVESRFWPLFEVEEGRWRLNYRPRRPIPVVDWLRRQGRFKHLFTEGCESMLDEIQARVDREWEDLVSRCAADKERAAGGESRTGEGGAEQ